jgi:hypothetical protein
LFRIHESGSDSESLVLTESKNNYFPKIGGTKKCLAQTPAAPPVYTNAPLNLFSMAKFIESLDIFGKPVS